MRFTRDPSGSISVRQIEGSSVRIGERFYDMPVAFTGERVLDDWRAKPIADLGPEDFDEVIDLEPEVIVLGTGRTSQFAPRELVFALARRSIGFEVMDSAAAARTFNVLASEGRRVAAILYP